MWAEVVRQFSDETILRSHLEQSIPDTDRARDDKAMEALQAAKQAVKKERDKLIDLYLSEGIDRASYDERLAMVKKKADALLSSEAEILERQDQRKKAQASIETIEQLVQLARDGLPKFDYEDRRAFLEAINLRCVMDDMKVRMEGLITDRTLDLAEKQAEQGITLDQTIISVSSLLTSAAR